MRSPSAGCGLPSTALPSASITRPSRSGPTRSQRVVRTSRTRLPRRTPRQVAQRIEQRQVVAEADHFGQQRRARLALDFGHRPDRRGKARRGNRHADRPHHAARQAVGITPSSCSARSNMVHIPRHPLRVAAKLIIRLLFAILLFQLFFDALQLRLELLVDHAEAGFHAAAAGSNFGVGLHFHFNMGR